MKRFAGQTFIVTGGANGIGFTIGTRLFSEGMTHGSVFDVNEEACKAAVEKFSKMGFSASYKVVDVTNWSSMKAAVDAVVAATGRIDVIVQAAGVTGKTNIKTHEVDPDNWDLVMDINAKGVFHGCKAVLPYMLKADYGRIVNIASVSGKDGNAGMLAYSTSKAAVIGMTKVMGKEYAETGITVNCIAPAVVRTAMVDALPEQQVKYMTDKIPMKRCGTVDEMAGLAAFIASPECSFTTAFCFDATGGRSTY
jgi:3-oxoacyl-[acyl-carrier protein] reductase